MTMSLDCSPERVHAPVVSTMSAGIDDVCFLCGPRVVFYSDALEQEVPLKQLSDIKAESIVEWAACHVNVSTNEPKFEDCFMSEVDRNA